MCERISLALMTGFVLASAVVGYAESAPTVPTNVLLWQEKVKEIDVSPSEATKEIQFQFQNTTDQVIELKAIKVSCSCLTAELPEKRRYLPRETGKITLVFEPGGRRGKLVRHIFVQTSTSIDRLLLNINLPSARSVSGVPPDANVKVP